MTRTLIALALGLGFSTAAYAHTTTICTTDNGDGTTDIHFGTYTSGHGGSWAATVVVDGTSYGPFSSWESGVTSSTYPGADACVVSTYRTSSRWFTMTVTATYGSHSIRTSDTSNEYDWGVMPSGSAATYMTFGWTDSDGDGVPDHEDDCPAEDATGYDLDGDGCLDDTDGDGVTDDIDLCDEDPADYYGYDVTEDGCMSDLINAGGCPLAAAIRDNDTDFDNMADRWGLLAVGNATIDGGSSEGTLRVFGDGDLYSFNVGTDPIDPANYSYAGLGDLYARSGNFNKNVRADNVDVDETVSIGGSTSTAAAGGHIAAYMRALSKDMYGHPTNGDTTVQSWGTVEFEGTHPMMNTFRVSAADFGASTYMDIDIPEGSTAVINVVGDPATFGPTGVTMSTGVDASDVVYNFYPAHDLELDGVSIKGQVVAPWADVDLVSGDITGTLTGNNLDGTVTQYNGAFDGRACAEVEAKAAPSCSVSHIVTSSWGSGYNASVTITNSGSGASSWEAGWTFTGGESVSSGWGGTYTTSGADVSIENLSWNGALGTGDSVTIGYTGSGSPAALSNLAASCE